MNDQPSLLNRLNVGTKLTLIPLIFIIAIGGMLFYINQTLQERHYEANAIDIAGRQRVLNQWHSKDLLLATEGKKTDYLYWRQIFNESAQALLNGGSTIATLKSDTRIILNPAPNEAIRAKLREQQKLMEELSAKGDDLLLLKADDPAYKKTRDQLLKMDEHLHFVINEGMKLYTEDSRKNIDNMIRDITMLGFGTALLGFLLSWGIARGVTHPLGQLANAARELASGNLKLDKMAVNTTDEVGQLALAFNDMTDSLREIALQNRQGTENLNAASAEILASVQQQTASTQEQASAVQQTTATMEEVKQSGAQIAERAKSVAANAEAASASTQAGLQSVKETVEMMESMRVQVSEVAQNIVNLSEKNQAVGEIIALVTDIAEQSNLLALNAAIEAASAGEQGRSFSVVASEMKHLADQAKEATGQVRGILGQIQTGINSAVMLTEETVKRVESSRKQTDVTDQTIRQMTDTTQQSIQAFQQIVAATNQQQIGFEQVFLALQNIRLGTEQTATSSSQLNKAASNLNALSQQLRTSVERYKI